jgi:CubicO group peptidase (beta-lactamase class C family)
MLLPLISLTVALQGGATPPVRPAASVGMDQARLQEVDRIVNRGIQAGAYPGGVLVIARRGGVVVNKGYGRLGWTTRSARPDENTIYDLASLTKPIVLATSAMLLVDEGKLSLDARVVDILPEFAGPGKERVRVHHLLSHTAGIPAGRQLWRTANSAEEAWRQVLRSPVQLPPGHTMTYSDLGAMIMGKVIEKVSGMPLDQFARTRIFEPLGMFDTFYRPADSLRARIAPTEVGPPRGYSLRGEVHDEAAWRLGGVAGHAGLFGSAHDLAIFAQMMANRGEVNGVRLIADSTVRRFTREEKTKRTLGWELANKERGSGEFLSERAYGHTGFTGTSIWIDPDRQLFIVFLTNRAHDPRTRRSLTVIADVRHDLADAAALSIRDVPTLAQISWPRDFRVDQRIDWNPNTRSLVTRPTTRPRQSAPSSP